jgi:PAS domain S-box-containing protein
MIENLNNSLPKFLRAGGEIGQIINDKNWKNHPLGNPENWPISLKIALTNIFNSAFPMLILWGKDSICFYNEAYRPSLGVDGKHPFIIGQKVEEAWTESWTTIRPFVEQVWKTKEPVWRENELIPILRNGKIEDTFWTFSYGTLIDEEENMNGILITCTETTQSVINHNKLKESEDQLKFAINAADLAAWDYNPKTNKFTGNDRLKSWFGIPHEENLELAIATDCILPENRQQVTEAIERALLGENNGKYDITYPIRNKQTNVKKIVRAMGRAWFNDTGDAYRFNGILQDVTQQIKSAEKLKLANHQIRKEELRFRNTVQKAPVGIAIFKGEDLIVEMANLSLLEILDRTEEELLGNKLFQILPEIKIWVTPLFEDIKIKKEPVKVTGFKMPIKRQGTVQTAYFDFILQPVVIDENEGMEIILVATEVTDYILARNVLKENEDQFQRLVMQSPIAMAIFRGQSLQIEMANQKMLEHFWSRKSEEVLGKELLKVFPELEEQIFIDELRKVLDSGIPVKSTETKALVHTDGIEREFYVDYDYLPLTELDGSISGVMITVTDYTDRFLAKQKLISFSKDLEKQVENRTELLRKSNDKLQRLVVNLENANDELESFAYVSSHDLQEPLRKIQMFTSRILDTDEENLSPTGIKYFDKISGSVNRMRRLIDDLLSFSRTDADKSRFVSTDLNEIFDEAVDTLSNQIETTNAQITCVELPLVSAIPFQMGQVFTNLLGNSLKFARKDTPPQVRINSKIVNGKDLENLELNFDKSYYEITIEDNGIGFSEDKASKIFDIFERLHGRSDYEGTGIGLSIVKKIILNHDGAIIASSSYGHGAVFYIYLPLNNNLSTLE